MKQKIRAAIVIVLFTASCGLSEVGGPDSGVVSDGIWGGPIGGNENTGTMSQAYYMTVMDYKRGYDWHSDSDRGEVKCSLVVYRNEAPIMKVPVGDNYDVSADPDMHRLSGGHLYTDFVTESSTIIKKDGAYLLSYPERERIGSMIVLDEDIYTLGFSDETSGFSFRKNGQIQMARKNAYLIGPLRRAGDSLFYAFSEKIRISEGVIERYYCVSSGKVSQVAAREDVEKVWDISACGDNIIYLASLTGVPAPVLVCPGSMFALAMPKGSSFISGSIFRVTDKIYVEGIMRLADGLRQSVVWIDGEIIVSFPESSISSIWADNDGLCCVVNPQHKGSSGLIYRSGEIYTMPEGYVCMNNCCMSMINGMLHVGLSSPEGGKPLVWKDGQVDSLEINGYISGLYVDQDSHVSNLD